MCGHTSHSNSIKVTIVGLFFIIGCVFFSEMVSPRRARKITPNNVEKNSKCFDSIDSAIVLSILTCKVDAKSIPDALRHAPEMFLGVPGPENMV